MFIFIILYGLKTDLVRKCKVIVIEYLKQPLFNGEFYRYLTEKNTVK